MVNVDDLQSLIESIYGTDLQLRTLSVNAVASITLNEVAYTLEESTTVNVMPRGEYIDVPDDSFDITTIFIELAPASDIDLDSIDDTSVRLLTYTINGVPEGASVGEFILIIDSISIAHAEGVVIADDLQKVVETIYGKFPEMRTLTVTLQVNVTVDEVEYTLSATTTVNVTPRSVPLCEGVPEYYLVGGLQGWDNTSRVAALYPVDAANGIVSYTADFSVGSNGSIPNFKIFSRAQIDADDWLDCYGSSVNDDTSLSGVLVNGGEVGAIMCPTNGIYTLTADMRYQTYTLELFDNQAATSYSSLGIIGDFNNWDKQEAMTEIASHNWYIEGLVLSEDAVLKFRADDNWDTSWGNTQNIGELSYGYMSDGENLTVPAGTYSVYFNDITTQAFFVENPDYVPTEPTEPTEVICLEYYLVGGLQGWDNENKGAAFYPIEAVEGTASYTTNFSTYPDGTTDVPNFKIFSLEQIGSWDNCYGTATDGDTSLEGLITFNGGAIQCPTNDYYTLTINMLNDTYTLELLDDQALISYTSLGLIGAFNDWAEQDAMIEVTPHNWYLEGFVQSADGELKFRANDTWEVSWGNDQNIGELCYGYMPANGLNITVPAGTYNVYFNDITTQAFFVAQ